MAAKSLNGIALITGAASGIGLETACAFAEAGVKAIAFADINESGAQEGAEKSKKLATNPEYRTLAVKLDVTDPESVQSMVDATVKEFGRIDYAINSAGIGIDTHTPISECSLSEFDKLHTINNRGTLLCVRAISRAMLQQDPLPPLPSLNGGPTFPRPLGRGAIVNLGSANSIVAVPGQTPYTVAKHAVIGITKTAAMELGAAGVRVNAVLPSWVKTPMMERGGLNDTEEGQSLKGFISGRVPLGRIALPEEVADVIVFLAGPGASYVNGVALRIDGGVTLGAYVAA